MKMTTDAKPREFWILEDARGKCATTVTNSEVIAKERKLFDDNIFHVIEKSAYDALAAKNHTLKLKFEEINLSWQAVCADMEAKLAIAVEALKEISNPNDSLPDTNYYAICEYDIRRAKNALSKIGGAE